MKIVFKGLFPLLLASVLTACNTFHQQKQPSAINAIQDSIQLKDLVKQYLHWSDSNAAHYNTLFIQVKKQATHNAYAVDWNQVNKDIASLQSTEMFAPAFIDLYKSTASYLDSELKTGAVVWVEGEVSNYAAADMDAWCNCQDKPDSFLEKIALSPIVYDNNKARFGWHWEGANEYQVVAQKNNGKWQIVYLEGFDRKYYKGN